MIGVALAALIAVQSAGAVDLVVVTAGSGAPVVEASAVLETTGDTLQADADGRILFTSVPEGQHWLTIFADGFRTERQRLQVTGGQTLRVRIALTASPAVPPRRQDAGGVVMGRISAAGSGDPLAGVHVSIEGTGRSTSTNEDGRYRLAGVSPGPAVLRAEHIGYVAARVNVLVRAGSPLVRDITMSEQALELEGIMVTADPIGRARGETGTATVVGADAIANQSATSLMGVLELVPGVEMQPPGLDGVQQISLRAAPTNTSLRGISAAQLASLGTLVVMDGIPLSNNANMQSLGPRGELALASSAGGGIDLRRIPASVVERVEVIRGIPSARWGDLTQGAIIVETRAAEVIPEALARYDGRTTEMRVIGGQAFGSAQAATMNMDFARTIVSPTSGDDERYRVSGQLSHRLAFGAPLDRTEDARLVLDTRLDMFQLFEDRPERPELVPGRLSWSRDNGQRLSVRGRLRLSEQATVRLWAAGDHLAQRSYSQATRIRPAMPFTDRTTPGRAIGHYIGGEYIAAVELDGDPWMVYGRGELDLEGRWGGGLGLRHRLRAGVEARREWNDGPGLQFDMEFPPQVHFTGVQGFDRPRRYDAVPPVASTGVYVDDRVHAQFGEDWSAVLQAGLRVDVLHDAGLLTGGRDVALQPRLNLELSPRPWLRLRAGAGRTTKSPTLGQLYPAPRYFDIVNVNWFTDDPAERLAVLTTYVLDPTNPALGYSVSDKLEAGLEVGLGQPGAVLSLVAFADRIRGGVGIEGDPTFLLREHFALSDSTFGTGRPPEILEPPTHVDTVPVLRRMPANNLTLTTRGIEVTAALPELRALRLRAEVQGAFMKSRFRQHALEFDPFFEPFQVSEQQLRSPYWEGTTYTGSHALATYRLIHHRPDVGLVVTATLQHNLYEDRRDLAGADTLSFAGYITRAGELVEVPPADRTLPQYSDLRQSRRGLLTGETGIPADWILGLQVAKTLPLGGRFSFYAFNVLDRVGRYREVGNSGRRYPPLRFGAELVLPMPWLTGAAP